MSPAFFLSGTAASGKIQCFGRICLFIINLDVLMLCLNNYFCTDTTLIMPILTCYQEHDLRRKRYHPGLH